MTCLTSFILPFLLTGCLAPGSTIEWSVPPKPEMEEVIFLPVNQADIKDNGFYISNEGAYNLANNIDELKAYNEKMELLIKEMKKYYGDK